MTEPKEILLPEPEGFKRGAIRFRNGGLQTFNCSLGELREAVETFMADPKAPRFLELPDAQYGEPLYLTRTAIDNIDLLCVSWVKKVAPRPGILTAQPGDVPELRLHRQQ